MLRWGSTLFRYSPKNIAPEWTTLRKKKQPYSGRMTIRLCQNGKWVNLQRIRFWTKITFLERYFYFKLKSRLRSLLTNLSLMPTKFMQSSDNLLANFTQDPASLKLYRDPTEIKRATLRRTSFKQTSRNQTLSITLLIRRPNRARRPGRNQHTRQLLFVARESTFSSHRSTSWPDWRIEGWARSAGPRFRHGQTHLCIGFPLLLRYGANCLLDDKFKGLNKWRPGLMSGSSLTRDDLCHRQIQRFVIGELRDFLNKDTQHSNWTPSFLSA